MQDFAIYGAVRGTYAGLTTWAATRNSEHTFVLGADAPPAPVEEWAASYAGIAAYHTHIDPASVQFVAVGVRVASRGISVRLTGQLPSQYESYFDHFRIVGTSSCTEIKVLTDPQH